ncbi:hypothetical protein [Streptomyces harbinensis]|uniref:hypothetical protein n=1 Tax=Streptomyces harbinensis TaxID=1176198 RepID=UPI0036C6A3F2
MDTTAPACVACHRPLPAWDPSRFACVACHQQVDGALAELPALVAQLDVTPGRSGPRVGSLHAAAGSRPPIDLAVVDLRAQVHGVLASWVRDWAESGAGDEPTWPATETARVAAACRWLRWRLDWAVRMHPAVDEAVREIRDAHREVRLAVEGRDERAIRLACPCGSTVSATVSSAGATCPACGVRYGRSELLALPVAARGRAAA